MIAMKKQTPTATADIQVGVDFDGTNIAVLVVGAKQTELAKLTFAADITSKDSTFISIADAIRFTLKFANISLNNVEGIGIGVPGKVNPVTGDVRFVDNLNWGFYPVSKLLQEKLGVPCYLGNNVQIAALGAQYFAYPNIENLIYVTVGTSASVGIIRNNELEQVEDDLLVAMKQDGGVTAVSIFAAAAENDPHAQAIIDHAGVMLGRGLQHLIMTYDPDKIIIGGDISYAGDPFLKSIFREWRRQQATSPLAANLLQEAKLELAPINHNFGTWGGIALVRRHATQVHSN